MDRRPNTAPPVMELLEAPRGLGFTIDELEELILALDDRAETQGDPFRVRNLTNARRKAERELGRIAALG